jgi:hypothetical protein
VFDLAISGCAFYRFIKRKRAVAPAGHVVSLVNTTPRLPGLHFTASKRPERTRMGRCLSKAER